ncbi:MAG: HlyD family efflux transporter periplasmic adaptor subunit [Clostridia bacterium]|nr:HlyD family efflux transporter periplasmic adaptor subunit [Clostridia bacterium]
MKKKKKRRAGRIAKRAVKTVVLLGVVGAAGMFGLKAYIQKQADDSDSESYSRSAVQRGAMEETVYGTGTTSARSQPNILAEADGTLTDLRVSIGDTVKAGDILAVITNDELDDTITDLEFSLWDLDDQITGTAAGAKVTSIEAPVAGRIMAIYAEKGDDALAVFRREGALAIISTDGRMKVEVDSEERALNVALGDTVEVSGVNMETVTGTVTDLTRQGTHATVTIGTDELTMGAAVTVSTLEGEKLGEGTLEVNKPMAVSSYGGTIKSVRVSVGSTVKRLDTLFTLEDSPLTLTVENLRLQREAAAKELADAKQQRESLIVVAPCDGVVASLDVSEGDEVTSGTLLGSILEGEDMNLIIAVDELDVVEVEIGQPVTITVDALGDTEIEGEVYKIAPVGTNSGGVTTYDVELTLDASGTGVRSGMNATGEIQVASTEDTLYVPVEAVMTINDETYVMVADGGSSSLTAAMSAGRQTGSGGRSQGGMRGGGQGEAPDMMGEGAPEGMPDMSALQGATDGENTETGGGQAAEPNSAAGQDGEQSLPARIVAAVRAWLYEGIDMGADQVTGSLVKVEVGMQNDDYAEILSGVSEGDVVLYTASSSSESFSFGGRQGDGGMMMMGF